MPLIKQLQTSTHLPPVNYRRPVVLLGLLKDVLGDSLINNHPSVFETCVPRMFCHPSCCLIKVFVSFTLRLDLNLVILVSWLIAYYFRSKVFFDKVEQNFFRPLLRKF